MKAVFKKSTKRGFALAEVIVALVIIVLVCGAALSFVASHSRLERHSIEAIESAEIAESIIECFRWNLKHGGELEQTLLAAGFSQNNDVYTASYGSSSAPRIYEIGIQTAETQEGQRKITVSVKSPSALITEQEYISYLN